MNLSPHPLLRVANLVVRYPGNPHPTLAGISLALNHGDRLLLLGPSGAGKTTFLLSLAGIVPQVIYADTRGRIDVDSLDALHTLPATLARSIGFLFQDPDAQLCMPTVEEEVAFGLENLGVLPEAMEPRIRIALDAVGLSSRRTVRIDRLSGGLRQRLALADVLAMGAPLLLLDEPTAHLDPSGTREFFDVLERISPPALILVEHKLEHVVPLITRVMALTTDGHVLVEGSPDVVFGQQTGLLEGAGIWLPPAVRIARAAGVGEAILTLDGLHAAMRSSMDTAHKIIQVLPAPRPPVAAGPAAISVSALSYQYARGPQALYDVTLHVAEGDFCALVGSNGSGKTTLALHLVGILQPPPGCVAILGQDIAQVSAKDIPPLIGYVFQNPEHQFVTDTVLDEVRYTLHRQGLGEPQATAEAQRVLPRYGLEDAASLHPYQLSQGAKRRLSVLTVLAAAPKVLVLDEPTFGQDARTNYALLAEMVRLNERGLTVLMITHDMEAVGQFARSVAIMHEGRIIHRGTVADLPRYRGRLDEAGLELPFAMRVRGLVGVA